MKPSVLLTWAIAVAASALVIGAAVFLMIDWYYADFSRLAAFLDMKGGISPIAQAALAVLYAAVPATVVVFLFRGARGDLELSALGIKLKGPAGPILLWVVCFVVVGVLILAIARL